MKIKRSVLIMLLALTAVLLCACGKAEAPAPVAPEVGPAEQAEVTPAPTPAPQAAGDEAFLSVFLTELPDRIQPGSAGCSLKAVAQSVPLLDWAAATAMSADALNEFVTAFIAELSEQDKPMFDESIRLLDSTCTLLKDAGQEELLESAGCTDTNYPWPEDAFAVVDALMSAAGFR